MVPLSAVVVVVVVGIALLGIRWLRARSATSAEAWAVDPIGPDDLAG
ncbi:hypothetical protein ACFYVR_13635 [Rhodococcus sp. NPDC003318]